MIVFFLLFWISISCEEAISFDFFRFSNYIIFLNKVLIPCCKVFHRKVSARNGVSFDRRFEKFLCLIFVRLVTIRQRYISINLDVPRIWKFFFFLTISLNWVLIKLEHLNTWNFFEKPLILEWHQFSSVFKVPWNFIATDFFWYSASTSSVTTHSFSSNKISVQKFPHAKQTLSENCSSDLLSEMRFLKHSKNAKKIDWTN